MKTSFLRYAPVTLFLLFLFWVIYAADTGTFPLLLRQVYGFRGGDWIGHFVLYGTLAWLAVRAFPRRVTVFGWQVPLAALLVISMAALEELSQFWFPRRTPDWVDLSLGVLGISVGTWLGKWRK